MYQLTEAWYQSIQTHARLRLCIGVTNDISWQCVCYLLCPYCILALLLLTHCQWQSFTAHKYDYLHHRIVYLGIWSYNLTFEYDLLSCKQKQQIYPAFPLDMATDRPQQATPTTVSDVLRTYHSVEWKKIWSIILTLYYCTYVPG